jgi:hypothetical protein
MKVSLIRFKPSSVKKMFIMTDNYWVLLRVPQSIVFSVRFLCIAGYCLAFVSIELRILCAVDVPHRRNPII